MDSGVKGWWSQGVVGFKGVVGVKRVVRVRVVGSTSRSTQMKST